MKKSKLSRSITLILVTLFVLIVGTIIAGVFFSNKAMAAAPTCQRCSTNSYMDKVLSSTTTTTHTYQCTNPSCMASNSGNPVTLTESHTWSALEWENPSSTSHRYTKTCTVCNYLYRGAIAECTGYEKHESGGKCETCGQKIATHTVTTTYNEGSGGKHGVIYGCSYSGCGYSSGTTEDCSGGTHSNGGKCTKCGDTYQTHSKGSRIRYNTTNTTHTAVYACTYSSCSSTYKGNAINHTITFKDKGDGTHSGTCTVCDKTVTEDHKHSTYTDNKDGTHSSNCTKCSFVLTENHKGATHDNDGKCTECEAQYQIHKATETIKEYTDKTETKHTPVYTCSFEGCTSTFKGTAANHTGGNHENDGICTICTHKYQTHGQSETIKEYIKAQSGHTPIYKCKESTCDTTYNGTEAAHTGATHDNDGKCTVEGCGYQYEIHGMTETVTEYTDITETKHTPVYTCIFEGCTSTVKGTAENHTGGTHENDGKCTLCGKQYQNHGQSTDIAEYIQHETIHTETYKCTEPTCTKMYTGLSEKHKGATHDNGGICTVCEYQYEKHEVSDEFAKYEITETGHTTLNKCTFEGCEGTHKVGNEEPHTGATHENDGICTVCSHKYQIHGISEEQAGYEKTETGHTKLYKCTFTGCEGTHKVGEEEAHTGGTHENNGICTVCEYQYQVHGISEEQAGYYQTETGHTKLFKCTFTGCEGTHKVGEEEVHTGATHENGGICTICEYQYETHEQTEEIAKYMIDEKVHLILYKCSHPGCTSSFPGSAEDHKGGTHENGGKCTVCEHQYQKHNASTEIVEYDTTETAHTPKYKCTFEGCEKIHIGEEEAHKGGTHENDGICTVCGEKYQTHGKSEEVKEYKPTEDGHKPIYECIHPECTETYEGEEEEHTGGTHENGGVCDKCGETYEEHGKSDTVKEYKPTENGHKPIYECINGECDGTYEGEEELHDVKNWEDTQNGVHTGECDKCGEQVTEEHNYGEDGTCEDCEARVPAEECEHTYKIEKNETHHWNFCPKCQTAEEGTLELHQYGEYTVNEDGTHSATCTVCEYELTEKHNYGDDGKCEDCETRIPADECTHSYEMKHDETHHWNFCPKCETIEEGSKENHTYGKYVDNGDGTHSATCTKCEYKLTEQHNEDCDKCKESESKPGDGGNGTNGGNTTNGDNTTADKEIPKAGMESMILGLIISIGALAIVTTLKMKKYKDI